MVHQRIGVVPISIGKSEVDGVVVFTVFVPADLAPKEGTPDTVTDLLRAQSIAACLVAVNGNWHFWLGLFYASSKLEQMGQRSVTSRSFMARRRGSLEC